MKLALLLFIPLFALICTNLAYVLALSLWLALAPLAAVLLVLILAWLGGVSHGVRLRLLSRLSQLTLLVVAAALAWQAGLALNATALDVNVGRLLPLFIGALALFAFHLLLRETTVTEERAADQLAHLLNGPPLLSSLCTALILAAYTLLLLGWAETTVAGMESITVRFLQRGIIPPITLLLFYWGLLLLTGKWLIMLYFRQAIAGQQAYFTAPIRLRQALAALQAEPDALEDRLQVLWHRSEQFYLLPRYLSWAVPVLGFIGTVLGISLAADGIRKIIGSESGLSGLSSDLGQAIAPLGIAFDTTLIALSLSIVLVLCQTLVQRNEESVLSILEEQLREGVREKNS